MTLHVEVQPTPPLIPQSLTLLDVVLAVAAHARTDEEIVATVHHLIESGQVRLEGQFREGDVN